MERPNILFVMMDQLPASILGCYGSGLSVSPTLDRLAREGTRFERCYVSIPVCGPSRATLFTGRSPVVHGVTDNNYELKSDIPTLFQVLQADGYKTGGFGKFHLTSMGAPLPPDFSSLGFNETAATEDPKLGPWIDWVRREYPEDAEHALSITWPIDYSRQYGVTNEDLFSRIQTARRNILQPIRAASDWPSAYSSPLRKELHQTTWITDQSLDFIARHLDSEPESPFCAFVSYVDPHDPYDPPVPYNTMFSPEEMPDPLPGTWQQKGNPVLERSKDYLNFRKVEGDVRAIKQARALYAGSVRFVDDQINRILEYLEQKGLKENTIIVFTSDHGDLIGDHGLPGKGQKHYDKAIHCPLIVSGPGIGKDCVLSQLVCTLDFFPSVCELAECTRSLPPLEGRSFTPALRGQTSSEAWHEVTVEYCANEEDSVRSIITSDGWRFTIYHTDGLGEMFDLTADPDEQVNLFYESQYRERKLSLYERFSRAYMRSARIPQYRNCPEVNGVKVELKSGTLGDPARKLMIPRGTSHGE
ncbi:MAG: sulfatase-like hydrolase/transferase [Verrucomicrobia bacterium]|nr:sulfatase-like hydrolase/transferase [Verrucomicrobiota bacterium]